jgi:glycosyltransferase involved in cell wall biosynthesis
MAQSGDRPRLSIGCAVYNSDEPRLCRALDAVCAQTLTDFEVIICDNSPDTATRDLCMAYVETDARFRYLHNDVNLGAYPSFWRTLHAAGGSLFKWVADDDTLDPTYFARCVEVLEADPGVALCHTGVTALDPGGAPIELPTPAIEALQDDPADRFLAVLDHPWQAHGFYGVFRTARLRRTHPISHDRVRLADILLLAEISLAGKIHRIPDTLFTYTQRPKPWDDREKLNASQYATCFPLIEDRGITFPNCAFATGLMEAVRYADLPRPTRERLYRAIPAKIRGRIGGLWQQEIQRAVRLVLGHRILHNWGDAIEPFDAARLLEELPGTHGFHAAELLRRFDEVMFLWPDYPQPGIHAARAVLLVLLGRVDEAHAALQIEHRRHPEFEPAAAMLRNLEAATLARSAG